MKSAALALLVAVLPLAAAADPPGRVGRLAAIEGEVSVFAEAARGWEPAALNVPLTSENSVWTEPGARADLRAGSIALRLAPTTQLDIVQLDDDTLRAHLMRGSLALRVRHFEPGESLVVTTASARFEIQGNGRFRIDADDTRGESLVSVFSGTVRLVAAGGYVHVDTGRALRVAGGESTGFALEDARESELDRWAAARDDRYADGPAARYVSPRVTGWEDLDAYGEWRTEPEIGVVWYPTRVVAGWAPYRYGRWVWVRPWGWTWVDDAPWGYAPFHYGRWVWVGHRWGWYPGPRVPRPVWAPALVGWVGAPGWSVSFSTGPMNVVGWYPLSPYDRYQPWYAAPPTYVTNVNHVVIVDRRPPHHRDHRDNRDRGATVVGRDHFTSHKPVQNGIARVPRDVVAAQPISQGSAVLPAPRDDGRWRPRPAEPAPSVGSARPARPAFDARPPSAPSAKPELPPESAQPLPASPTERPPQAAVPPRPYPSPRPAERPHEKPAVPAPPAAPAAPPASAPSARPAQPLAPATPPASAPSHRPPQRPAPPEPAAGSPTARPAAPGAPVPSAGSATRPAPPQAAPATPAAPPSAKPAPAAPASEKPANRGSDKPAAKSQEKPGKSQD